MNNHFRFAHTFALGICSLLIVTAAQAQDTTCRFGVGYSAGGNSGVNLTWTTESHRIDLILSGSYSTFDQPGPNTYSGTNESASLALGYSWTTPIANNFSLVFGPRVFFGGSRTSSQESGIPSDSVESTLSNFTTSLELSAGPEYAISRHFSVGGLSILSVSTVGLAHVTGNYPSSTKSTSVSLGGSLTAWYYF